VDNVLLDCGEVTSFRLDSHAISGARSSDRPLIKCSETTSYQDIISDQIPVDFQRYLEEGKNLGLDPLTCAVHVQFRASAVRN